MLGNGNTVVVELAEALAPVVPVDDPHFLFAADGAVAVEQALKIAFQYWVNRGVDGPHRASSPSATPTTATPSARSRSATAACSAPCSIRCASRSCARRATPIPGWAAKACAAVEAHADELAAVVIEPLVQGASGMLCAARGRRAAARRGVPQRRRAADLRRGGDRVRADRDAVRLRAVRPAARPAVPGQGDHRRLPGHVGHGGLGRGVRRVPRRRPRAADLLPRALLRRECPGRGGGARAPAPDRGVGCAGQRAGPGRPAGRPAGRAGRRPARRARGAPARPHGRRRAGAARHRGCAGAGGSAPARSRGACCCARSATSWCSCRR